MNNKKDNKLHPPSDEQLKIINALNKNNVWIQAVAGSGKTTTSLHIADNFKCKKILLLTYNSKLSLETKERVKFLNLKNLDVYTFHAFAAKIWAENCQTDNGLLKIINFNLSPIQPISYDLIIIDEAQDINPVYYEILCKIIVNNNKKFKLCILGDKNQSIYNFNNADFRYLVFANELFNLNDDTWQYCKLSQSFRLNKSMVNFINEVFFQQQIMTSSINSDDKNDYIVTNTFSSPELVQIIFDLIKKYDKSNVFILAPSITSQSSPVRQITNKLSNKGILIYAPINDYEKLDSKEMINKLCLSTFHQAKGLERKVVVVFGFDIGYFQYNAKHDDPLVPHNALYVAITRALEKLIIVHHIENQPLPFINKDKIKETTNFKIFAEDFKKIKFELFFKKKYEKVEKAVKNDVNVTKLLRHLPSTIVSFCMENIEKREIKDGYTNNKQKKLFNIKNKIKLEKNNEKYQENVSPITGTAAILNYQKVTTKKSTPLKVLLNEIYKNYDKTKQEVPNLLKYINFLKELEKKEKWTVNQILLLSTLWNYFMDGYNFKLNQIPKENFNWVTEEDFEKINALIKSKISINVKFEVGIIKDERPELFKKRLIGFIDCIDLENKIIWEFKFVDKVVDEHFLQLAMYAYLISTNQKYKVQKFKYYIFNIKRNQLFELKVNLQNLIKIVETIFKHKFGKENKISDEEFLKQNIEIMTKIKTN